MLADELLKLATKHKKEKNMEEAIICLRQANEKMSMRLYPIESFLRLPLYLQQNGEYESSVIEFEKLINRFEEQVKYDCVFPMIQSVIYDKMALVAKREKLILFAVFYSILSDAFRMLGLKMQKRKEELNHFKDEHDLKLILHKLLNDEIIASNLISAYTTYATECNKVALKKLANDTSTALDISIYSTKNFYLCKQSTIK